MPYNHSRLSGANSSFLGGKRSSMKAQQRATASRGKADKKHATVKKSDYQKLYQACGITKEVTKEGRFYSHLEDFIYNQHITDEIEEVLNHSVWKSDGKIYFQLASLEKYLRKIQFKEFSTTQMGSLIRDKGGDSKQIRLNKNSVKNLFFIPDPKPQDEGKLAVPKVTDDVPF